MIMQVWNIVRNREGDGYRAELYDDQAAERVAEYLSENGYVEAELDADWVYSLYDFAKFGS